MSQHVAVSQLCYARCIFLSMLTADREASLVCGKEGMACEGPLGTGRPQGILWCAGCYKASKL